MDIQLLSYFLTVAQEGNITKSARLLYVAQPTLSRQLMRLEEELGVKLFKRTSHNINLTEEGIIFRRRAQEILSLMKKIQEELKQDKNNVSGTVTIGCGEMQSVKELGKIIADFQILYPLVKFELYSGSNEDIKEKIEQGILDMGLFLEPAGLLKYDFVRMKTKEQWGVLIHEDASLAFQKVIQPGDLVGTKVATIHINTPVHHELAVWSKDFAKEMDLCINYNVLHNAVMVAREKKGAVVCLKLDCHYDNMKFIPLEPKLELASVLAWKDFQQASKPVSVFIKYIKSIY